jgi:hypothetical protein
MLLISTPYQLRKNESLEQFKSVESTGILVWIFLPTLGYYSENYLKILKQGKKSVQMDDPTTRTRTEIHEN